MEEVRRHIGWLVALVAMTLLAGCAGDDQSAASAEEELTELTISVADSDWQGQTINITRSGETLEGLQAIVDVANPADGEGFGIYGHALLSSDAQRQVTWNGTTGQWNSGSKIYWKRTSASNVFNVYAYAPYKTAGYRHTEVYRGEQSAWNCKLTFKASDDNGTNIDLLYAAATVDKTNGQAAFEFRHAMAQISFGTITNSTGEAMTLNRITFEGELHQSGKLDLADGTWSETAAYDPALKSFTRYDFDPDADGNQALALADGDIKTLNVASFILIPGPPVTITLDFGSGGSYSFSTTLEQGKNKTYNITVQKNFEVVIE